MESKFNGTVGEIFVFCLWMPIFIGITLGFGTPYVICTLIRWVCDKSVINGKRYKFNGTAGGLFGNYIKWSILTMVTLGIYSFWMIRNEVKWVVENLEMVG